MSASREFEGAELVGTVHTFYTDPEDVRFELALENAERYQSANVPLVVVDASQDPWVAAAMEKRGAFVLPAAQPRIATQRQQGVRYAHTHGADYIVGHEPEKTHMVDFKAEIRGGLDNADVLVIGRTQRAENSLPPVQQRTERLAGWSLEKALVLPPDTLSGGRAFTGSGAVMLDHYPAEAPGMNNWLYLYEVPLAARNFMPVGGILVDLVHPEKMVKEETGNPAFDAKRYDQFRVQLDYLLREHEDEVVDETRPIVAAILRGLEDLPPKSTNKEYEAYFDDLEEELAQYGYTSVDRD